MTFDTFMDRLCAAIAIGTLAAAFAMPAKPAIVCQVPVLSPDGVDLPDGDPCLGPTITASGEWLVGLNDNATRPDHDFNDLMFRLSFMPSAGGVLGHYIYLGGASAHYIQAEIAGVLYGAADAAMGWFAAGSVVPVFVIDNTEGERLDASNPQNGWAQQVPTEPVPEPATTSMLVVALGGLVWWRTWRVRQ